MGEIHRGLKAIALAGLLLGALMVLTPQDVWAADDVVEVVMQNLAFHPKELTVPAGTTVRFINQDVLAHNVVQARPDQVRSADFGFESSQIQNGESWDYTFQTPGEYPLLCTTGSHFLLGMTMTVTVE